MEPDSVDEGGGQDDDEDSGPNSEDEGSEQADWDSSEEEPWPEDGQLLGSREDRTALRDVLRQFSRDDLADTGDDVVAAIRMQVHQVSAFQRRLRVVLSLGLYLLFQAPEGQGVMMLTRKGRVINAGMNSHSEARRVMAYFCRILFNLALIGSFVFLALVVGVRRFNLQAKLVVIPTLLLAAVLICLCLYGARPRRDCGSDFRQQFNVADLCVASYSRVDTWSCCFRKRRGHLRLCFGKFYPDNIALHEGLPQGVPNIGCLVPAATMAPSKAGETSASDQQKHHERKTAQRAATGRSQEGLSPMTTCVLAFLGLVGGIYEAVAVFKSTKEYSDNVCVEKVKGCSWMVPNVMQMSHVPGEANPPKDFQNPAHNFGCNSFGEFCTYYYRPITFCSVDPNINPGIEVEVKLTCSELDKVLGAVQKESERQGGRRKASVVYKVIREFSVQTMAVTGKPKGGQVSLFPGLKLVRIGSQTTSESRQLNHSEGVDFERLRSRCEQDEGSYQGAVRFVFHKYPETVPLQDSDCDQLQQACEAEEFGPSHNGWMPAWRLLRPDFRRTVCAFQPDWFTLLGGSVYWHEMDALEEGLTCHGEPGHSVRISDPVREDAERQCQRECDLHKDWCQYAFYAPADEYFDTSVEGALNSTSSFDGNCLLYDECPDKETVHENIPEQFEEIVCGEAVSNLTHYGGLVPFSAVEKRMVKTPMTLDRCMKSCATVKDRHCHAIALDATGSCTLYGADWMQPAGDWMRLSPETKGIVGSKGERCFFQLPELPTSRLRTNTTGKLFMRRDHAGCSGCRQHELLLWLFEWQNFAAVLSSFLSVFGFAFIVHRSYDDQQWRTNNFTGKPIIDFEILYDSKNRESFERREAAYRQFLNKCADVKGDSPATAASSKTVSTGRYDVDCWDWPEDLVDDLDFEPGVRHKVIPVSGGSLEDYTLTDVRMKTCYVDRELLGLLEKERVLTAWPERRRVGWWKLVVFLFVFLALVCVTESLIPPEWHYGHSLRIKRFMYCAVPLVMFLIFLTEYQRGIDGICVLTTGGRFLQVSRHPLRRCCPHLFTHQAIRIDSFHVGKILSAQLDMCTVPRLKDRLEAWPAEAGRRGNVTIRCEHGFLEVVRESGDVFAVFQSLNALVDKKRVEGLPESPASNHTICGLSPVRHIVSSGESHVWTRRFDSYGHYGDPYNYCSTLTITDYQTIIVRANTPKPCSLRGLVVGPRTLGTRCLWLQDLLGHTAYISVCTLGHNNLASYATQRMRAPPFWPGLLSPVTSCVVSLLPTFMRIYPAGFSVSQKPYGLRRQVRTTQEMTLKPTTDRKLFISTSHHRGAPRGQVVDEVNGDLTQRLVESEGSDLDEVVVEAGSDIVLEAASEDWTTVADEPWLAQIRTIYDHILGRKEADEAAFEADDEPAPPPPTPGGCSAFCARLVGHDMLGRRCTAQELAGALQMHGRRLSAPEVSDSDSESVSYVPLK